MPPKSGIAKSIRRDENRISRALKQESTHLRGKLQRSSNVANFKSEKTREAAPPVAMGFQTMMHSETEHRVRGLDLVGTVAGSTATGTQLLRFPFYPAAIQNTRLQLYSTMWEKYRINGLRYHVRTGAATTLVGTYVGYVDFDPLDDNNNLEVAVRTALDHQGSVESSQYMPSIVSAIQRGKQNMLYTQGATGRTQDLLVHSVFYMIQNIPSTTATFASVLVEYDITFYNAVNESILTLPQAASWYTGSSANITTAQPLGLVTDILTAQTGSVLTLVVNTNAYNDFGLGHNDSTSLPINSVVFRRPGVWSVEMRWAAVTSVTTPAATLFTNVDTSTYGSLARVGTDRALGSTLTSASVNTVVRAVKGSAAQSILGYLTYSATIVGNASFVLEIHQLPDLTAANWALPKAIKYQKIEEIEVKSDTKPVMASCPTRELSTTTTASEREFDCVSYTAYGARDVPTTPARTPPDKIQKWILAPS